MTVIGRFGGLTFQRLKIKRVSPTITETAAQQPPTAALGLNFAAVGNSGLLILLEDI